MPKVSVIIPTYNRSGYLKRTVSSVLSQTYSDYEIIIIDDGSTDNTREVLHPYLDMIRYIYQQNAGVSAARNAGIKAARGNWIAFLDSDDQWHVDKLAMQMSFICKNNVKVCFSDVIVETETESSDKNFLIDDCITKIYDDPFDLLFGINTCLLLSTMIIEKSLILENICFDVNMRVAEDTKLIYALALQVKFGYVSCPLTIFNRDEKRNGLINQDSETARLLKVYHLEILSQTYEKMRLHNRKNRKKLGRMLSHYLSLNAVDIAISGDYVKARSYAFRACGLGGHYKTYRRALVILIIPHLVKFFARNASGL